MTREETSVLIDSENYICILEYKSGHSIIYKSGKQIKELEDFMLDAVQMIICGKIVYHWAGIKDEDFHS